jgi:hypothetical protein
MSRRPTFSAQRWPMDEQSLQQARSWATGIATQVLDLTWRAFDKLQAEDLRHVDLRKPLDQLERDLTASHFMHINQLWKQEDEGYSSICPHHEFPEQETRPGGKGKPPAYDLAFVYMANRRVAWPIEAKVLPTPGSLAQYLEDVDKFVSGIAAPFTGEGGVIAYLLTGREADLFAQIKARLGQDLLAPIADALTRRAHRTTHHVRAMAPNLQLHHMAMPCGAGYAAN